MNEIDIFYIAVVVVPCILGVLAWRLAKNRRKNSAETSETFKVLLWNFLLLTIIISFVFASGETYFRFFVDTTDSFALTKITKRWGERYYRTNNYKWRDNVDYELQKSAGKKRISFVGDSFTAGHGIKNVDQRFTNIIRNLHPDIEIHTLASNGFETIDEWEIIIQNEKINYETDVLILVYNLNDISPFVRETKAIYETIFAFEKELNYFQRESYLVNTLSFRWKAITDPHIGQYYQFVSTAYMGKPWTQQAVLLEQIKNKLESQGIQLLVVTFPFLHDLGSYDFGDVHKQIERFWQKQEVQHLDLLPMFTQHQNRILVVNDYDAHPNELAHKLAAVEIEQFILKNIEQ